MLRREPGVPLIDECELGDAGRQVIRMAVDQPGSLIL
jgi:hypothetical protein